MNQCSQCGRPAVYEWGKHFLCVSCGSQVLQAQAAQQRADNERLAHLMAHQNYLSEMMSWMVGLRSTEPKYQIPQPVYANINRGPTLNHINIDRSVIGMLNAGSIRDVQSIDVHVNGLVESGSPEVASALKAITEAVASNQELSDDQRSDLLDQLNLVSEQAALPSIQRKPGIFKPVLSGLAGGLQAVASLAEVWSVAGDFVCAHFGVENPFKVTP